MTPLEVVVLKEPVEIGLDLLGVLVPGGPSGNAEALVEQRPVHPLDEAIGAGRTDFRGAVLDPLHCDEQFVRMLFLDAAELAAVIGEDRADFDAERSVEGQDADIERVAGGNRYLGAVDLADALQSSPVEGVLVEQFAGDEKF